MNRPLEIASRLLDENYDEHVKAYDRVQNWDKAHAIYQDLLGKKRQAADLFKKLGDSIAYERALARVGLSKDDVECPITGQQIGAVDDFKGKRSVRRCSNAYCRCRSNVPETQEKCLDCGEPITTRDIPYAPSDLRMKYANYIFGVELKDGGRVWFNEPIPPTERI